MVRLVGQAVILSVLKRGIYGVYRVVSKKYLQAYIDEYAWRNSHRKYEDRMFEILLKQVAEVKVITPKVISLVI